MGFSEGYTYYSLSDRERELVILRIRDVLREFGVALGILFGSFVELGEFRDIDIAIYGRGLNLNKLLSLGARLEEALGMPVDVVPLTDVDPGFRLSIMERGVVVLEDADGVFEALMSEALDELYVMTHDEATA
ncbi:nucleotidyltransferase family protein [Vulcanisaeta sp. JCM 14467]|uniref:nucleotidyltransferase family protein n=1 Tax=Vulcanisaeta sp. JCM 14467 TaxID=1295370 RepID=UPI0006D1B3D6|nr:nucleotidyltransferase domain-containing protein [Vulcanisaeta sp. JCM 14467]